MPLPVNVTNSLRAGIQSALKEMWKQEYPTWKKQVEILAKMIPVTNIRKEPLAWKESLPMLKYWGYNMPRTYQSLKDRYIEISIYAYELSIEWNKFDEEDDQLGDLRQHVSYAINRFKMLPMQLMSEYFNGVASLNPQISTCWDGVSLFSATDGDGAARFGATGGNIVTGSGPTVAGVEHDLPVVQRRLLSFKDTAGQPIFDEDAVDYSKLRVIAPNSLNEVMQKASKAEYLRISPDNQVSESNWLKGTFNYKLLSYLTDTSDYYVVVDHPFWKPFAYRAPKDVKQIWGDENNSDRARETYSSALYGHVRAGLAPWAPFVIVKVNN